MKKHNKKKKSCDFFFYSFNIDIQVSNYCTAGAGVVASTGAVSSTTGAGTSSTTGAGTSSTTGAGVSSTTVVGLEQPTNKTALNDNNNRANNFFITKRINK